MKRVPDRVDPWLGDATTGQGWTGFDPGGWERNVWVLHRTYAHPGMPSDVSYDDLEGESLALGDPLLSGAVLTGIPLGGRDRPRGSERVRWIELLEHHGNPAGICDFPPCFRWFSFRSWPAKIEPPCEGSLEPDDLNDLLRVLAAHSPSGLRTPSTFRFANLACGASDEAIAYSGELGDVVSIYGEREQSPNNFWPEDRSWFVYTDWDLLGTKISGSAALIADLEATEDLETVSWP